MSQNNRVLFIDDDPTVLNGIRRLLSREYNASFAAGGEPALEMIAHQEPFAVIVSDMRMPGIDGIELMRRVQGLSPDSVRVMLTGNVDQATAVSAVNDGRVFRFLNKPCDGVKLRSVLNEALAHHELLTTRRVLLESTLAGSIHILTDVLGLVNPQAFGDAQGMRNDARALCASAGYADAWQIEIAASLCRIGEVAVPASILAKRRAGQPLNDTEVELLEQVPSIGHDLLARIPHLETVSLGVLYQNRRFEARSAPCGEEIPRIARILKVLLDMRDLESHGVERKTAVVSMAGRRGFYDPAILEDARRCFGAPPARPSVVARSARCLTVGQVPAADVVALDGTQVLSEGVATTRAQLQLLLGYARIGMVQEPIQVYAAA